MGLMESITICVYVFCYCYDELGIVTVFFRIALAQFTVRVSEKKNEFDATPLLEIVPSLSFSDSREGTKASTIYLLHLIIIIITV